MKIAKQCVACGGDNLDRRAAVLMPFIASRVFGWEPVEISAEWGLRTIPTGTAVSLCNSMLCHGCGMMFLDMRFDDEEMRALYDDYRGEAYAALRDRFEPGYRARNTILVGGSGYIAAIEDLIRPHLNGAPRVLDWGGDTGINTPFRTSARAHHVFDISNRPVLPGVRAVGTDEIAANDYDLFVFSNVLEHVSSPHQALAELAAAMKEETLLYVEVPHEDIIRELELPRERLERKRHWHEHVNFFTTDALDTLFQRVGLQTIERLSQPVSAGGKESHVFSIVARRAT